VANDEPFPFVGPRSVVSATLAAAAPAPARQTLDHLRADLSHEMAAKLARLSALVREWRAGRHHDSDADDAAHILADIERLHRRHARVAAGSFGTFALLTRVLDEVAGLRRAAASAARPGRVDPAALERAERLLPALTATSRRLTEALSSRYGARFGELVSAAAEEIRREAATGERAVPVEIDSADGGAAAWVPRADAARWSDVLRNLMRNAVQATAVRDGLPTPPVTVRLRPAPGRGGARVEICDEGIGMAADQVEAMWRDGRSRHGEDHGQGLTENKRAFVEQHATLEIRSLPGVGTCVSLELPPRDVAFRPPRPWAAPPLAVPALVLVLLLAGAAWELRRTEMVAVTVTNSHLVSGLDRRGHVLWQRELSDRVAPNWRSLLRAERQAAEVEALPLVVPAPGTDDPLAIISTIADQGPGRVLAFDTHGRERWSHTLSWATPRVTHTGALMTAFQAATVWNDGARPAIALNVRDGNWSSTSIQFFDTAGRLLGAYLHPGHLEFVSSGDLDDDGRVEVLLNGRNNDAVADSTFWTGPPCPEGYTDCLILLESPTVDGQAFPYARWSAAPRAREDAYLLIPPLRPGDYADPHASTMVRMAFGKNHFEVSMTDGRIYVLDHHLRPLSCNVGDHTPADELAPTRASAPLLYLKDGRPEAIDLPVQRGS
jgi:signal transduction histidine kinase